MKITIFIGQNEEEMNLWITEKPIPDPNSNLTYEKILKVYDNKLGYIEL